MSYEQDIKNLIEKMNHQYNIPTGNKQKTTSPSQPQMPTGFQGNQIGDSGTDQSPHLFRNNGPIPDSPDQTPPDAVNSVRPMGTPIGQQVKILNRSNVMPAAPPPGTTKTGNECPQCGTIHPPLPPGAKCPMTPVKVGNGKEEKTIDVNKFLVDLKNIIISQAESKGVKDYEKLFKNIIVETTKFLEGYKE